MFYICVAPLPPAEIRIETLAYTAHNYEVSWSKYDSKSHVEEWLLSYNSSKDNGKEIYLSWSASGERISYKLNDLQGEQTYTVMVKGKVKDVFSTPTVITIESKVYLMHTYSCIYTFFVFFHSS
jgi:hypothetical protein